ncbi:restriction endonuclease subunit S [Hydrogenophaga sp. H7]|uniref:restriction endonuclease subunit S n=1 Tax=Hydrogenophaga sp. H7 TaxID=1882399 RepID=UPI00117AFB8D|nr:restriction endonuclease subunit S [Hydrogenophaga sp. H7]
MYNIEAGSIVWRDIKRMKVTPTEQADYGLLEGDLLVNRVNSRELVGKAAVIPAGMEPSVFESKNIRVRLDAEKALPKFISYQLFARGSRHFANNAQQVVGMASISQGQLADFPIVLTDLDEQRRIVAEIDKQFSRLDEAVANLQRVKANLKRYKAAVLKAAVEGRLVETEASIARREGRGYETGEQLLHRVLVDRKTNWSGKGKYVKPAMPDLGSLPALPDGWIWATAEAVCDPVVDCHNKTAPYVNSGIPLIRTTNIRDGQLLMDGMRFVDQPTYDFWSRRCPPAPGDVLFTREAPMGEACIVPAGMTVCLGQRTMLMRPSPAITASFLLAALMSPVIGHLIDRVAVGSGVKHLRVGDVERLPIPLPPKAEQLRIVTELDRLLSVQQTVEAEVDANLRRAATLRAAVLSRSFQSTH